MNKLENRTGLVAFLDILGYANILENNSPEYIANEVFRVLSEAREFTRKTLPKITNFEPVRSFDYGLIDFMSFSDSILISVDLRSIPEKEMCNSLFVYFLYCSFISRMMHENGLPIRGAIDHGEYIMVDNFIAGVPIIESYKLGNRLEMEGVVLTSQASELVLDICDDSEWGIHHMVAPYLVPLKDGEEEKLHVLSPSPCTTPIIGDLRQYVLQAFWKHSKDIPLSVRKKVDNTEQYLRFLKTFHDHLFADHSAAKPARQRASSSKKSRKKKNS